MVVCCFVYEHATKDRNATKGMPVVTITKRPACFVPIPNMIVKRSVEQSLLSESGSILPTREQTKLDQGKDKTFAVPQDHSHIGRQLTSHPAAKYATQTGVGTVDSYPAELSSSSSGFHARSFACRALSFSVLGDATSFLTVRSTSVLTLANSARAFFDMQ